MPNDYDDDLDVKMKVEDFETYEPKNSKKKTSNNKKTKSMNNKKVDCSICNHSCSKKGNLQRHVKTNHVQNCHLCYEYFDSQDELTSHISSEHKREENKLNLSCAICDWKTGWRRSLLSHITTTHKDLHCCKVYDNTIQLHDHILENHAKFHCLICAEAKFSNYENLKEHMKSEHNMEYQCPTCRIFYPSDSELGSHRASKHPFIKKKKFMRICNICQAEYKSYMGLRNHKETVHENKPKPSWFCPTCGKKFTQEKTLNLHIATNCATDGRQKICSKCKKQFESRVQWIEHVQSDHKDIKVYECSQCEYKSLTKTLLRGHVHGAHENRNVCSFCGKNYNNQAVLRKHIAFIHEGKKNPRVKCSMCEVTFAHPMSLKKHVESVHEGIKHQCSYCGEIFDSNHLLGTHIAFKHDRSKLFECSVCKAGYRHKENLQSHIEFVHEKKGGHICSACGKKYATKGEVKKHFAFVHEQIKYECDMCDKSLSSKYNLKLHVEKHHEGKKPSVECPTCSKCFQSNTSLKRHVNDVHEKKRPFGCDFCGLTFAQKSQLVTHMKGKHRNLEPI